MAINSKDIAKGHFDLSLKHWLKQQGVQEKVQSSILYPPMGNYTQHASDCGPKRYGEEHGGRPSDWGKPFVSDGDEGGG